MARLFMIHSISFCLVMRSSLSRLMRLNSRIFQSSYSSASFFSSLSSINSMSEASFSLRPSRSISSSRLISSMSSPFDSAFRSFNFSFCFLSASSSSLFMASFSFTVSRWFLDTNTGLSRAARLGSSTSEPDSSSLSSSSTSSSTNPASCSFLSSSSSCLRCCNASTLARSRRRAPVSASSVSFLPGLAKATSTTGCTPSAATSSTLGLRSSSSFSSFNGSSFSGSLFSGSSFSGSPFCSAGGSSTCASPTARCRINLSVPDSLGPWHALRRFKRLLLASSSTTAAAVLLLFPCLPVSRRESDPFSSVGFSDLSSLPSFGIQLGAFPGQYLPTRVELS
mmetsp:Transcript_2591/g.6078  ORF Transcript_2591/g.6078 Transcript_2591/m.6078 type:complete len:338 (-) Transcript_2591:212-1225(-)